MVSYSGTSDGTRRNMEELTKEADAMKVQMLKYTSAKTRGVVKKGNLGAVEPKRISERNKRA